MQVVHATGLAQSTMQAALSQGSSDHTLALTQADNQYETSVTQAAWSSHDASVATADAALADQSLSLEQTQLPGTLNLGLGLGSGRCRRGPCQRTGVEHFGPQCSGRRRG